MTPRLIDAVAALLRVMPRNPLAIEVSEALRDAVANRSNADANGLSNADAPANKSNAKPTRAPNGTFDRTAYQRDLMRKRRASAREAKV